MSNSRQLTALFVASLAFGLLLLGGCALFSPQTALETRASRYYNFMAGRSPQGSFSGYLSPAYKKQFEREALTKLDESHRTKQANTRYPEVEKRDVKVVLEDRFAYSAVNPQLGDVYASQPPQRWVKVGSGWYVYGGSQAEIEAYGTFPDTLAPVPPSAFDERNKREPLQLKPRKGQEAEGETDEKGTGDGKNDGK